MSFSVLFEIMKCQLLFFGMVGSNIAELPVCDFLCYLSIVVCIMNSSFIPEIEMESQNSSFRNVWPFFLG